jgi:hypothetical protein
VNHSCGEELQGVFAERKGGVVFHGDDALGGYGFAEEAGHHLHGLGRAYHLHFGIAIDHFFNERGVVGLHVAHDEIVGFALAEHFGEIGFPFVGLACIDSVEYGHFLIHDDV